MHRNCIKLFQHVKLLVEISKFVCDVLQSHLSFRLFWCCSDRGRLRLHDLGIACAWHLSRLLAILGRSLLSRFWTSRILCHDNHHDIVSGRYYLIRRFQALERLCYFDVLLRSLSLWHFYVFAINCCLLSRSFDSDLNRCLFDSELCCELLLHFKLVESKYTSLLS